MTENQSIAPKGLIAMGMWLLLASFVSSITNAPSNFAISQSQRVKPTILPQGHLILRTTSDGFTEIKFAKEDYKQSASHEIGGANVHSIPFSWAVTGLSLSFLGIVGYLFSEWRRPGPGLASEDSEAHLTEIAMAAITSGSGKIAGEILITVEKPLGISLGEKKGGGVQVNFVNPLGNGAKAGLKPGDMIVYHSSYFGEELWPADKLAFCRQTINSCPDIVDFIVLRGAAAEDVNIRGLPKRPAPPRIGRKLTAAQRARATHICLDCGWIYALPTAFDDQPKDYRCPQCQATKSRFAKYNVETGKIVGGGLPQGIVAGVLGGVALVAVLGYIALSL
eukprot:EG_transcript_14703